MTKERRENLVLKDSEATLEQQELKVQRGTPDQPDPRDHLEKRSVLKVLVGI